MSFAKPRRRPLPRPKPGSAPRPTNVFNSAGENARAFGSPCGRERQRQLRRIAQEFKETGAASIRARPELKPGTRLVREWQGRTYEVLVLDDGFSWQDTHHRSLSALARKITGTPWSGPLFFGLKPNRPANRRSSQPVYPTGAAMESNNASG